MKKRYSKKTPWIKTRYASAALETDYIFARSCFLRGFRQGSHLSDIADAAEQVNVARNDILGFAEAMQRINTTYTSGGGGAADHRINGPVRIAFDGCLSDSEMRMITANPWDVLERLK